MSDPFRDGMQAALARSENLEEENEVLRSEIAALRSTVEGLRVEATTSPQTKGAPEARALADKALEVLDQLEVVSRRGSKLRVALEPGKTFTGAERPLDAVVPDAPTRAAAPEEVLPDVRPSPAAPARMTPEAERTLFATMIILCIVFFLIGLAVGASLR
jgi:hypothetical protein